MSNGPMPATGQAAIESSRFDRILDALERANAACVGANNSLNQITARLVGPPPPPEAKPEPEAPSPVSILDKIEYQVAALLTRCDENRKLVDMLDGIVR